ILLLQGGIVFFPVASQVRHGFELKLNLATRKWLTDEIGIEPYSGSEKFRSNRRSSWYLSENFLVNFYDGQDVIVNGLLDDAFSLRKKANTMYWIGGITGGLGSALFFVGLLQAFAGEDIAGTTLTVSSVLILTSPITLISGHVYKNRARKRLKSASYRWYERITN
ncbi:MAG: hypothetical protein AAFN93_27705, partial [Bacteroidota bacterium]